MPTKIVLPCGGGKSTHQINKLKDKVVFRTDGKCTFTSFNFVPNEPAPEFSDRRPKHGGGPEISYEYTGNAIPSEGFEFHYTTDSPKKGNGTGVIKN